MTFEDTSIKAMPISALASNVTIAELEEYSSYNITVTIGNSMISDSVIAATDESGNYCGESPPSYILHGKSTKALSQLDL